MRRAIVEQERQRLLQEHASKLLGYLPKVQYMINISLIYIDISLIYIVFLRVYYVEMISHYLGKILKMPTKVDRSIYLVMMGGRKMNK